LIPWPLRPAAATPAPTPHAAAGGASAVSTRLRSLAGPWLVASSASSAPDDAAIDAYLNTLKWDDKGLLVAIAQARAAAAGRAVARRALHDPRRLTHCTGCVFCMRTRVYVYVCAVARAERGHGRHHDAGLRKPAGGEAHADNGQGARPCVRKFRKARAPRNR
jgi:hypothetical protein